MSVPDRSTATDPALPLAGVAEPDLLEEVTEERHDVAEPRRRRSELVFNEPGGPLVVVCGLHGGAGTSTLAYLLAHYSAQHSTAPVLVCEAPAASGNQAALSALHSDVSLVDLAASRVAGHQPPGVWWAQRENLRILATAPQRPPDPALAGDAPGVLGAARAEHGLTIVDAGTLLDDTARRLLPAASHVIWTLAALPGAGDRMRGLLGSDLVPPMAGAQAVAVRASRRRDVLSSVVRDVRRVAESYQARRLLLLPEDPAVSEIPMRLDREPLHRQLASLARFLLEP